MNLLALLLCLALSAGALPPAPAIDAEPETPPTESSGEEEGAREETDAALLLFENAVVDYVVARSIMSKSKRYVFRDPKSKKSWSLKFLRVKPQSLGSDGESRRCGSAEFQTSGESQVDLGFELIKEDERWRVSMARLQHADNRVLFRWGQACSILRPSSKFNKK